MKCLECSFEVGRKRVLKEAEVCEDPTTALSNDVGMSTELLIGLKAAQASSRWQLV
jgi:hypothetical protein